MKDHRKFDLEERTTVFGSAIIRFVDRLPNTVAGRHMGGQLIRCGTAPAFHYGESQSAESPRDFIHKIRIAHKELKESRSNIRMLKGAELLPAADEGMNWLLAEIEELIKIFGKVLATAKKNQANGQDSSNKSQGSSNKSQDSSNKSQDSSNKSQDSSNKSQDSRNKSQGSSNKSQDSSNK